MSKKPVRITARPSWWPCAYPESMIGRTFTYRMGDERLRLKKPHRIPVSKWAEKYRVVTQSSRPGKWSNETAAYQVGIMDAIDHPAVETVVSCKPPQTGGTECAHNFVGSRVDMDPGEILYVYPDDSTATLNSKDRIQPMLENSPRMRSYMTGSDDDLSGKRIKLKHMTIYLASAQSASQLANKPCRYVVFDEIDKYPAELKGEADPISLGRKRTTTYAYGRKMIELSSPTTENGNVWTSLKTCQLVFHYWPRCPHCGEHQPMHFSGITWDGGKDADPEDVRSYGLAWYDCRHCGAAWTDSDRDEAVLNGEWRADSGGHPMFEDMDQANGDALGLELFSALDLVQPKKIGFHMSAWVSPWVSLSECAAAFLDGQRDKAKLKDFSNGYEAVPWREMFVERQESAIMALRDDRPRGLVPGGGQVACLIGTVDTQDNGFWYEIRAHGYGWLQESWCVREGFIPADWRKVEAADLPGRMWPYHPAFDPLRQVLFEDIYADAEGIQYPVQIALIDAMGHYTAEVYDFCRVHRHLIYPLQGVRKMSSDYAFSDIDHYPGTNRKIMGGVKLVRANVTTYKDRMAAKLSILPADPGAWLYHGEIDTAWARQMVAEYKNDKTGYWECPKGRDNHAWDCSVYQMVAADIKGVKMWPRPENRMAQFKSPQAVNPYTGGKQMFGAGR